MLIGLAAHLRDPGSSKGIVEFVSGAQSFPAQSEVQSEAGLNFPVVLDISRKIQGRK